MEYTKESLQELVNQCFTYADVCRKLNLVPRGGNFARVKNLITQYKINTSHFLGVHWSKGKKIKGYKQRSLEEILVKNSTYKSTLHLKERLIKEGIKEAKCECCGFNEILELHHINGDCTDNRLENLQLLCPNCHAKTQNFRCKNSSNKGRRVIPWSELIIDEDAVKNREKLRNEEKKKYKYKRKSPIKTIPRYTKTCKICGKEYKTNDNSQKFCSQNCYNQDRSSDRPDIITLIKKFKELKSFVKVGEYFGVSDNAVRKWCMLYKIPLKHKEFNIFLNKIEIKE